VKILCPIVALLLLISLRTQAGENVTPNLPETIAGTVTLEADEMEQLTRKTMAGSAIAVVLYGYTLTDWWSQGFTGRLRVVDEGWFGPDTYAGGADKIGHTYGAYTGTRLLAQTFKGYGHAPSSALRLAAATSFGTLLAVELLDGYSKEYSFSKEDLVMNGIGTGLAILIEKSPELDNLLDFRLQYWPSEVVRRENKFSPVSDYSGQTYLLVAKAAGVEALRQYQPLRYLELAVGYGSRGYRPDEGVLARSRRIYFGISLNVAEVLNDTVFKNASGSRGRNITSSMLEFIQIPGTAILSDHLF